MPYISYFFVYTFYSPLAIWGGVITQYNNYFKDIAKNVKKYRLLNRLTQEQMAQHLNITTQHYAQLERNKRNFTLEHVLSICRIFRITVTEIIENPYKTSGKEKDISFDKANLVRDITSMLEAAPYGSLLIIQKLVEDLLPLL